MPVYIVTYDLNSPGQNYAGINNALESLRSDVFKLMESTWLVDSKNGSDWIHTYLAPYLDSNDVFLISRLANDWIASYPNQSVKDWLESKFRLP